MQVIIYQLTSCRIPEDSNLHYHSCDNFKFRSSLKIYRSQTNYGQTRSKLQLIFNIQ
jgi:hypothetical protein